MNATTLDGVKFRINLFKSKEDAAATIIEVEKLSGSSFSFKDIRRCIICAAKGLPALPKIPNSQSLSNIIMGESDFPSPSSEEQQTEIIRELKQCEIMLDSKNIDSVRLGIDILQTITNDACTFHTAASFASKAILGGRSEFRVLSKKIFSFLASDDVRCQSSNDSFPNLEFESRTRIFSLPVLRVLSNALTTLERREELKGVLDARPFLCDQFIVLLLDVLKEANNQPHDAYLSAKCIAVLVRESNEARSKARELDVLNTLMMTSRTGKRRHQLLAEESDYALASIY